MDSQAGLDELVAGWTLGGDELDLVAGKQGVFSVNEARSTDTSTE